MPRPLRERTPRVVALGGGHVRVGVRESGRARRARLVVHGRGEAEVVVPVGAPDAMVDRLLEANADWLARRLERSREAAGRSSTLGLDRPGVVWLAGRPVPVVRAVGGSAAARAVGGVLRVAGPDGEATGAVERWYRREARARLGTAVEREARKLSLAPGRLSVRDQKTRWGSCAPDGGLSFSWRLVLAPEGVLEYVVVHELCHLRRRDHSPAFWRLVGEALPDWKARARWLRDHGAALQAYAPAVALDGR